MRRLLNTLFVLTEDSYLALDGENVVVRCGDQEKARFPLHGLEGIVSFAYPGASPALMGACAEKGIGLSFHTPRGRFLARTCGVSSGNVLLRRVQYRVADDQSQSVLYARNMILGKVYNARWSLHRTLRDHVPESMRWIFAPPARTFRGYSRPLPERKKTASFGGWRGLRPTSTLTGWTI